MAEGNATTTTQAVATADIAKASAVVKRLTKNQLLSQSKNAASRSKWLFGLFAGLIGIISNNIFDSLPQTKKWIIFICLAGVVVNAFAMTNFEKIQFNLEREVGGSDTESLSNAKTDAATSDIKDFNTYKSRMALALIIGFGAGIFLVLSLFWKQLMELLNL